jgi:tRNA(Met) C34 N-acetyltransferase TmcA
MPVGMNVPQVGFDQKVAKTGAGDLKGMRIDRFTGSPQVMSKGLGRNLSAWAQELDLDTDAP